MRYRSRSGRQFMASAFFFFIVSFFILSSSINLVRFESLFEFYKLPFHLSNTEPSIDSRIENSLSNDIRILLGILTLPAKQDRWHFLRLIYGIQSPVGAKIDVKFVFCNLTTEDQKVKVALEIMRYDDIIILNCTENMDEGKTYTYFSSLPEMLSDRLDPPYHYVVKADDDTYFRLQALVDSLRKLPREDLYYGYVIPCPSMNPFKHYMSGMGFLVSWDIVEWIKSSDIPKKHLEGPEDMVFGQWLVDGHRGQTRYNVKWSMYNHPEPQTPYSHELWPDTIAVHNLKTEEKWIHTLSYFNVTKTLKSSKLYHIS